MTLNYMAANSVDKAIGDSVTSDIYLIGISIAIFVVLAVTFLSRCGGFHVLSYYLHCAISCVLLEPEQ